MCVSESGLVLNRDALASPNTREEVTVGAYRVLLAGLLVSGCAPRSDPVVAEPDRVITGRFGAIPGYSVKQVLGKLRDTEVLGNDGSVCRLTAERVAQVEVGDWLACNWTITPDTLPSIARAAA
jgi:hypothetical protein